MTEPDLTTRTEGEGETLDLPEGMKGFAPGQVLGERYQILELLGRGGMGEVWHAFDLKLRVEVALKALRSEFFKSERRLELLRQEVRAAREVVSPNVCRIFDLIEVEGRELVSMEYVDGATLLGVLQERGPLELKEAQDIASQFLAGLEAIHKAGLIHRDIKPENIMLTRAGRVVVMDFGLARQETEGGGTVAGTPAYMSPEQAAGQTLDARADVYAAGVVLAEMVSPDGIKSYESRQSVWEGVRSEPAKVPETPWAAVIKKAVTKDREGRYNSAHTLTRALEDVTLRVEGAEDLHPYPGLASFTEADAEYFFGREAEVEQMWRRLDRPHLLAVVGPSGAGKTSFLRAGLIPSAGPGWRILRCTPGSTPFTALGQAMARELAGDIEAMELLAAGHDPDALVAIVARWRNKHDHTLVIFDQFEELFTQNPQDIQRGFSTLIGRLALEADVFVMLSMRDDFLIRCREHEALAPAFTDLTALLAPTGAALRRALTQPALQCGYRFEDDELVDEMLAEVEGERGALPLLAFAAARLWERRDKESGLLTRQAYQEIGGVGGALAQHAEATIARIGVEHIPIVRELFRNLVTAEGTRAVREWNELLSIFDGDHRRAGINPTPTKTGKAVGEGFIPSRTAAEEVLRELIDARLLTSYEVKEDENEPTRRVEIIHESLLANWPRLVRWQTQDADAAQLRDQLRQAAKTWHEHGHTDDMLWTGAAYREFAVWRERYPGGLSEVEEGFARAMTSLATRRRRRRRIAVATVITALVVGLAIVGAFWRRSVLETRRAEAQKLLALAQARLEKDPTEALAYATSSLELADTTEARLFAVRALWKGSPSREADAHQSVEGQFWEPVFSANNQWLAVTGIVNEHVLVYGVRGGEPIILPGHVRSASGGTYCRWSRSGFLVTGHNSEDRVRVWSMPAGDLVNTIEFGEPSLGWQVGDEHLFAKIGQRSEPGKPWPVRLVRWKMPDGEAEDLGTVDFSAVGQSSSIFDPKGSAWIYSKGDGVFSRPLPLIDDVSDTLLGRHSSDVLFVKFWNGGGEFFSVDSSGGAIIWTHTNGSWLPGQRMRLPRSTSDVLIPDCSGRRAMKYSLSGNPVTLWDLAGMPEANLLELRHTTSFAVQAFNPTGDWIVATAVEGLTRLWPLAKPLPIVLESWLSSGFTRDGRYLVASDYSVNHPETKVRLWPVPGNTHDDILDLMFPPGIGAVGHDITVDPAVRYVLALSYGSLSYLFSTTSGEARNLFGFPPSDRLVAGGFSPSGRLVAAASAQSEGQATLRVWDLDTDEVRVFEQPVDPEGYEGYAAVHLAFVDERSLYTAGANGLLRWDLDAGTYEKVMGPPSGGMVEMSMTADRQMALVWDTDSRYEPVPSSTKLFDVRTEVARDLGFLISGNPSISPDGTIWAAGQSDGTIQVGSMDGGTPHLLLGHEGAIGYKFISPDNAWLASWGVDDTSRVWPMPDLSKPPLHTLPHDELIAKLHSLTNLRAVRDEASFTGWKLEVGPFPGWAEVPEW